MRALWVVLLVIAPSVVALPIPQDDAGSGADAPDSRAGAVGIEPRVVYEGVSAHALDVDRYAFSALAGQRIAARATASGVCAWEILSPGGVVMDADCIAELDGSYRYDARALSDGRHFLRTDLVAGPYRFAFTVDGTRPPPLL